LLLTKQAKKKLKKNIFRN